MKVVFCKWLKNIQLEPPGTMSKKQPIDVESPFGQAVNVNEKRISNRKIEKNRPYEICSNGDIWLAPEVALTN